MYFDFSTKKFVFEESEGGRNDVELRMLELQTLYQPNFSVTADHIAGTRTSAVVFTPTVSESWTVDALIGKYMVAFVNTDATTYSAHKIADNDADTVTIDTTYGDATLLSSCDRIIIFDTWKDALDSCTFEAIDDSVDVTGDLAVSGAITVSGASGITLSNAETITNAVNGEVLVTGDLAVTGGLDVRHANGITLENDETITNSTNGQVDVNGFLGVKGGTTGGLVIKAAEDTVTLSGASGDIDVDVPAGAVLLMTQLRVDTLITSGDGATSWTAAYKTGATAQIATGQAFTKNTKVNAFFDANAATPITSDVTKITITPNSNTFSAGVVRAITYYMVAEAMADAA